MCMYSMFLLATESRAREFSSESRCCTQLFQVLQWTLYCDSPLLHIDCIYLNAISIIDDHYSFSLKSVREKLLQTPRKQQMSRCDVTMPLEIEKKKHFLFFCLSVEWSETTATATPQKTSSIHCFLHSLCWWFKGNMTANCHPVNPQWIQISLRIYWLWCGNNRRDSEQGLRMSLSEASNMQQLWSVEESVCPATHGNFCDTLHCLQCCAPARPPSCILPLFIFK